MKPLYHKVCVIKVLVSGMWHYVTGKVVPSVLKECVVVSDPMERHANHVTSWKCSIMPPWKPHNLQICMNWQKVSPNRLWKFSCCYQRIEWSLHLLKWNMMSLQVGGMGVAAAALVTTVAAPVMAASAAGAAVTGVYGAGRSIAALVDRGQHQQSINVTDAQARNCWLSLGGNVLGVASGQALRFVTKAAQNGQVVGK